MFIPSRNDSLVPPLDWKLTSGTLEWEANAMHEATIFTAHLKALR